jgi:hypothetical protein
VVRNDGVVPPRGRPAIDATTAAAFAMCGRPGAYALLLGSGISTGAGVPTGWWIVKLLIGRLATVAGEDVGDDPEAWYEAKYGEHPTYSRLIEGLGLTIAERQALITGFLSDDKGDPRRPAPAHHAVARLMRGGWVRVVVTTNFDRLLETALSEAGVNATVLATVDAVAGAVPLVHAGPVVVKLHGDQNDPRILNTEVELDEYEDEVNRLLDVVFNDYGLIVAGWSAQSDRALRAAIERAPSRRFTTFWTAYSELSPESQALVEARQAEVVGPVDADTFFGRLADACEALAALNVPDRRSVATAVAVAKRELAGAAVAIGLHDSIRAEVDRISNLEILSPQPTNDPGQLVVVDQAAAECELLVALVATAAYWGRPATDRWWTGDIVRLSRRTELGGTTSIIDRPRLPSLFMCWAAGVAAVASHRDDLLTTLFSLDDVSVPGQRVPVPGVFAAAPDVLHVSAPLDRLYRLLRPVFVDHLGIGVDGFVEAWERWQYLLIVAGTDMRSRRGVWVHLERSGVRVDGFKPVVPVPHSWAVLQTDRLGADHPLLGAGYFDGDPQKLLATIDEVAGVLAEAAEQADWGLLPSRGGGGMLPSGRHFPGSFSDNPDVVYGWPP